jgi:NADH-quinone oxidoreductase subunit N
MGASLLYGTTGSMAIDTFAKALGSGDNLARAAVVLVIRLR